VCVSFCKFLCVLFLIFVETRRENVCVLFLILHVCACVCPVSECTFFRKGPFGRTTIQHSPNTYIHTYIYLHSNVCVLFLH